MPRLLDLCCGIGGAADGYRDAGFDEIVGVDLEEKYGRPGKYPYEFVQADIRDVLQDVGFLRSFDLVHSSPPCQSFADGNGSKRGSWLYSEWYGPGGKKEDLIGLVRERLVSAGVPYVIENIDTAPLLEDKSVLICGTWTRKVGSEFGAIRHRLFECSWDIGQDSVFEMMGGRLCWCRLGNVKDRWPKIGEEGWVTVAGGTGPEYRNGVVTDRINSGYMDRAESRSSNTDQRIAMEDGGASCFEVIEASRQTRERHGGFTSEKGRRVESVGVGAYIARQALGIDRGTKEELNEAVPPAYTAIIGSSFLEL